jgi:hypothetical protein
MRTLRLIHGALLVLLMAACSTVPKAPASTRLPMQHPYRLLLVHPNIQVRELTADGALSFREEWAESSRRNMAGQLQRALEARAGSAVNVMDSVVAGADPAKVAELHLRHDALGKMLVRKKTVGNSLGDVAIDVGTGTKSDLLFIMHADYTVRTTGRKALIGVGMVGCAILSQALLGGANACGNPDDGDIAGFASLIDAQNGEILWTTVATQGFGDLRSDKQARKLAKVLTKKLPDLKPVGP